MPTFSTDEWLIVLLVFLLGLVLGMAAMAGGKWKQRYRDEVRKRQEAEAERDRLRTDVRHTEARTLVTDAHDRDRDGRPVT
ncbi:hypothetical protein [Allosphingosinicella sp.]|jgi:hypothetical protein|uniref:hypothetical protein n=1 Tax=Allosphingosinicella sp. TaxID=2823234 RepID=UPI002F1A06A7